MQKARGIEYKTDGKNMSNQVFIGIMSVSLTQTRDWDSGVFL